MEAGTSESFNSARQGAIVSKLRAQGTVEQEYFQDRPTRILRVGLEVTASRLLVATLEVALANLTEVARKNMTSSVVVSVAAANIDADTARQDIFTPFTAKSAVYQALVVRHASEC